MKLLSSRRRWSLLLCFFLPLQIFAQVREPFDQLNLSEVTSQFFYPQTYKNIDVPDPNFISAFDHPLSSSQCASLFMHFDKACLNQTAYINDFGTFRSQMHADAQGKGSIPISILDIAYHDFLSNAISDNMIEYSNGKFHDVIGRTQSPYQEKNALILWIDASVFRNEIMHFVIEPNWYVTNRGALPSSVQIDFDDGLGFRTMQFGQVASVDYTMGTQTRNIRCKVIRTGSVIRHASAQLKRQDSFGPCEFSLFPDPNAPPWNTTSGWDVTSNFGSEFIHGDAYTLTSEDNVFDKPFIFVEGIDFGLDENNEEIHEDIRNGNFGWCEFSSGFMDPDPTDDNDYPYGDLHLMPDLLNELRAYGYDIVLVDFYDGALDIDKNSELLQKVIRLCNQYKVGHESLVVAGASMGGLVSRHALRKMELNGEDHCTRLWITLDSPHCGADIPPAMQQAIKFNAEHDSEGAQIFRDEYLQRPASRQMLNYLACSDMTMHNNWFNLIDEMGYPKKCRTMAIANGRGDGVGLPVIYPRLMDWKCDVGITVLARDFLFHNAGDSQHPLSSATQNVLGLFRTTVTGLDQLGDDMWWGILGDYVDFEDAQIMTPVGQKNWDYAPGGTRTSIRTLALAMNLALDEQNLDNICSVVSSDDYNAKHCFVSTVSALGIHTNDPYIPILEYLQSHPEENHFDRVEFAPDENEGHAKLTEHNLQIVLDEVLGPERSGLGFELTNASSNNGVFNYGKVEFTTLKNLHIHHDGHLKVNSYVNTHFNETTDFLSDKNHFEIKTLDCTPAEILVDHDGYFEIGDEDIADRTADVFLNRDSKMTIGSNGHLKIFPGSRLILEEGSMLVIHPLAVVELVNGGRIVVKAGAEVIIKGNAEGQIENHVYLEGENSKIVFDGGTITIDPQTTFSIGEPGQPSGYIEIMTGSENTLHTSDNSIFRLVGNNQADLKLKANNYAHLQNANWHKGRMELKHCLIDLSNHGAIYTDMLFSATDVAFVGGEVFTQENGDVWVWTNLSDVHQCTFNRVQLHGHAASNHVSNSVFTGFGSGLDVFEGMYDVQNCVFDYSGISSAALQLTSSVSNSQFTGNSGTQLFDKSIVEVEVRKCTFTNSNSYGCHKVGGRLTLSCNAFYDVRGVRMDDGVLNMSSGSRGGYNDFTNTEPCITLNNAEDILLNRGYNNMKGYSYHCIEGTLNQPCGFKTLCENHINAMCNFWGWSLDEYGAPSEGGLVGPDPDAFDVHTSIVNACAGYENTNACSVLFLDPSPVTTTSCPIKLRPDLKGGGKLDVFGTKPTSPSNGKSNEIDASNPILQTANFSGITLDSALIFSALQLQAYDSLGNDAYGVSLFHEVLTSGLNDSISEIRWKMNWARSHMKWAVEHLFSEGELTPENNLLNFETPVQHYVDVLNLMTETELADSTYKNQFYLELDKGQLFRTLNKLQIAQEVFTHLDDCHLDSLEQITLNNWRAQVDLELSLSNQYFAEDVIPDSVDSSVDTTGYEEPIHFLTSDLYFGLWIDSPVSVTFVSCGANPVYRSLFFDAEKTSLFPNPSTGDVYVSGLYADMQYEISLLDLSGRIIEKFKIMGSANGKNNIHFNPATAAGTYLIRISNGIKSEDHLHVIAHK